MPTPLRVLILEDRSTDADLAVHELRRAGFAPDWQRAGSEEEFLAALEGGFDMILADYRLPGFTAFQALRHVQAQRLDIPVIVITGTLGDEEAVACIKQGADDVLLKDRLARLGPAVTRALEERRLRRERRLTDRQLQVEHALARAVIESDSLDEAIRRMMRAVGGHLGWDWSALWAVDRSANLLRCLATWHAPDLTVPEFETETSRLTVPHGSGLVGGVWASGRPNVLADIAADPAVLRAGVAGREGLHGAFAFPIRLAGEVIGVVELVSRKRGKPDGELLLLVAAIGSHLGQCLDRKRAEEALKTEVARLKTLNTIHKDLEGAVTADFDPSQCFESVVEHAVRLTGARYGALGVFDERGERLVQFITVGLDEAARQAIGAGPSGRGLLGHLVHEEGVLRLKDISQHHASSGFPPYHPPMHSFLGVSIRTRGKLFGRLYLTEKQGAEEFTDADAEVMAALAAQVGTALESAVLLRSTRAAEAKYRLLLESTGEGIAGLDTEGRCTFLNQAAMRMLGYAGEEILGKDLHAMTHHHHPGGAPYPEEDCPIYGAFRVGRTCRVETEVFWRRDGRPFPVAYAAFPIEDSGQITGAVMTFTDITERKEAEKALRNTEEQLRQSQKIEAIGLLAGGIAHDFNNLLTVINGYSDLLLHRLESEVPWRNDIIQIGEAGRKAALLTKQILAFSRKQVLEPRVLNLNDMVRNTEKLLRRLIGEDVTVACALDPTLGCVKVDPGQIEQVILNLAVNARDAMPHGGRLILETRNIELDEALARAHPAGRAGLYAVLAVSDTGIGMDAATQARLFEPFFTTKAPGKGTGLGLATVHGIVTQSGGHITVYSEPGRGATFKIYFPHVQDEASPAPASPVPVIGGSETIFVVEDEPVVALFVRSALKQYGYLVVEAGQGEEAQRFSARYDGPIHLLITDVVLPGVTGREVAARLTADRPAMKVLYMSGYADHAIVTQGVLDPGLAFLQKPFTAEALARKVREVLDA